MSEAPEEPEAEADEKGTAAPRLGVPKESLPGERRVAVTPDIVPALLKLGWEVHIEPGAGEAAGFTDEAYEKAGATLGQGESYRERSSVWTADLVVKVREPTVAEVGQMREGAALVSLLFPARNEATMQALVDKKVEAVALDKVPRITRAQSMDVLSSMANIAGYRAVLEASQVYEGFLGAQVTAAGTEPPAKVLVIGAGVAGLAAIAAARALGAEVRAFDVRPDTKEQVESLGAKFLMLDFEESGEGEGGYAKVMSKEFIEAEMALFRQQAKEVDVIVTTALVPGAKAPTLIETDMVEAMKPGSVVVDLAAHQGGNCTLSEPDVVVDHGGVKIIGYTDLPSRMATTSSRFFAANVRNLLKELGAPTEGALPLDLDNEIVRGALQVHEGELLPPPERKPQPSPKKAAPKTIEPKKPLEKPEPQQWRTVLGGALVLGIFTLVALTAPEAFVQRFTVFILACFVGWQVVWSVTAALHTPLMSVTNAISGIILVGGMLQGAQPTLNLATILGAVALFVASINVFGGFLVTQRMLRMFRKGD
ncbi:MAG: Re/Si-specific NAD(P)(+) transhydrogenase subunit alpha [Deltaproteobacteria bacterium]|nr:Re/Si-specific NAD(P)(+) transhydrogenase subunit alpha [Deltaproteobacteria bacterium]